MIKNFFLDEEGQDLVEYAMLLALIALVAAIALQTFGSSIAQAWISVGNRAAAQMGTSGGS
jgi:Flp pilus assembly pilin Flp